MVAGDSIGASWRRKSLEEAFKPLCHPASHLLWSSGGIQSEWTDVCGFVKPPKFQTEWLVRKHGAFEVDREELGLRDARCCGSRDARDNPHTLADEIRMKLFGDLVVGRPPDTCTVNRATSYVVLIEISTYSE